MIQMQGWLGPAPNGFNSNYLFDTLTSRNRPASSLSTGGHSSRPPTPAKQNSIQTARSKCGLSAKRNHRQRSRDAPHVPVDRTSEGEEGITNLIRAFLFAGAKSVVASLWVASDIYPGSRGWIIPSQTDSMGSKRALCE